MSDGLLPHHAALLAASAITDEVAAARGYRSVEQKTRLTELGFSSTQARVPALLIPIHNVHGQIATHQIRADDPRIVQGKPVKYETPRGSRMVLDVPPSSQVHLGDPAVPLFVTEAPRKADAAASVGLCCIAVIGVWNWRGSNEFGGKTALADWELIALNDRIVYVAFDSDVMTKISVHQALARLKGFLESRGAHVRLVYLPAGPDGSKVGLDDYLAAGHQVDDLLMLATPELRSSPPATMPTEPLDAEPRVQTPPAITSLAETLSAVEALLCRFVHFSDQAQPVAITLWVAVTYLWAQFETLAYLVLTSAVKQSGKTRTFDILELLVPSPWRVVRPSEAVTFRRIDRDHPTLLLDEYDTIFGDRGGQFEGIRSIFNSGNRRGTKVSRAVAKGKGFELVDFDIYSPKALAGIGSLPDTIADRAIVIHMSRRAPREWIERLRSRAAKARAKPIGEALAYYLGRLDLALAEPTIPDELGDRAQDGWEPLLAIAEAAGALWPARARMAAVALSAAGAADDESWAITLLGDVRTVFTEIGSDRLWTAPLIDALAAIEESPWGEVRGKPLSPTYLAKLLRPFGIGPKLVREGSEVKRGYLAGDFKDAWARYVPEDDPSPSRYDRYARYNDDGEAQGQPYSKEPPEPAVTVVTPVTGWLERDERVPQPPIAPAAIAGEEPTLWTA